MCGIAGFILPEPEGSARRRLQRMTDALAHRGPDGEGAVVLPEGRPRWIVGLGHRRLAILDLSDAGRQPMSTPHAQHWITFNGEIYNFADLRQQMEGKGEQFSTRCDSEVLLRLLARDGALGLSQCNGMWALGLWNAQDKSLLLARDRLGIKPLYYYYDPASGAFLFASEIKALLAAGVPPTFRREGLAEYLLVGHSIEPHTMFEGIQQLPPGCFLEYRQGTYRVERYWSLAPFLEQSAAASPDELLAHLDDSVRLRLISDVPVGAFLSGGVDSSAVVSSMAAVNGADDLRTFCVSFPGSSVDEARYARRMADHVRALHSELTFEPNGVSILADAVRHNDEPFADDAFLPTYMMCRAAHQEVKVALSGDGGDELFAGYDKYRTEQVASRLGPAGKWTVRALARGAGAVATAPMPVRLRERMNRMQRILGSAGLDPIERYVGKLALMSTDRVQQLAGVDIASARARVARHLLSTPTDDILAKMLHADVAFGLPNNMLRKVDRMSMAFGLEVRVPLLDYRLVQFAASLPSQQRICGLSPKYLLRQALRGRVPAELLSRPKQGFDVPLSAWFRGDLDGFLQQLLADNGTGELSPAAIERVQRDHRSGLADSSRVLFAIATYVIWHRLYVRERAYAPPAGEGLPLR